MPSESSKTDSSGGTEPIKPFEISSQDGDIMPLPKPNPKDVSFIGT